MKIASRRQKGEDPFSYEKQAGLIIQTNDAATTCGFYRHLGDLGRESDMTPITFQAISAATRADAEPGHLVWVRGRLVALLLQADGGWFLEHGLGPFERQDVVFASIACAESWIRRSLEGASDAIGE